MAEIIWDKEQYLSWADAAKARVHKQYSEIFDKIRARSQELGLSPSYVQGLEEALRIIETELEEK